MQDVIPPINGRPRGAIRPTARVESVPARPAAREAVRPTRSIDGMTAVRPSAPVPVAVPEPVPIQPPVAPPVPTGLVSDVKRISLAPVSEPAVAPKLDDDTSVEVAPLFPVNGATPEPSASAEPVGAPSPKKVKKKHDWKKWALISVAAILLVITAYVGIDTWLTNTKADNQAKTETTGVAAVEGATTAADEGQDESKITKETLGTYKVAADLPRALTIDKLNISARILPMTLNKTGSIKAPLNIYDSGWYTGSVKPGEIGAMFIDGHASGPTREGLFAYLDTLVEGDTLQVEKGDGTKLTYKVVHTEVVPLTDIDMKKVLLPYGNTSRALNLMTCTGKWLPKEYTYDHRVVVYTEQI